MNVGLGGDEREQRYLDVGIGAAPSELSGIMLVLVVARINFISFHFSSSSGLAHSLTHSLTHLLLLNGEEKKAPARNPGVAILELLGFFSIPLLTASTFSR